MLAFYAVRRTLRPAIVGRFSASLVWRGVKEKQTFLSHSQRSRFVRYRLGCHMFPCLRYARHPTLTPVAFTETDLNRLISRLKPISFERLQRSRTSLLGISSHTLTRVHSSGGIPSHRMLASEGPTSDAVSQTKPIASLHTESTEKCTVPFALSFPSVRPTINCDG